MKRPLTIASCACVLASAGCGSLGDDEVTERVRRSALLTKPQVERYPAGSPERAFLEWWRALQFDNAVVALRYYADSAGVTEAELEAILKAGSEARGLDKRPRIVEVDIDGDSAVVMTLLEIEDRNPNGRVDRSQRARGFNLVREDDRWRLAENNYLDRSQVIEDTFKREFERKQRERASP